LLPPDIRMKVGDVHVLQPPRRPLELLQHVAHDEEEEEEAGEDATGGSLRRRAARPREATEAGGREEVLRPALAASHVVSVDLVSTTSPCIAAATERARWRFRAADDKPAERRRIRRECTQLILQINALYTVYDMHVNALQIPSHCVEMSRVGVIPLLLNIYQEREHNYGILIVIARIIGNFALNEELHIPLYQAGWVTILAHWIRSPNLKLSIQASRALANIDRDFGGKKYEKGIYLVYPEYRTDHMLCADVVFVHGLLGGPFKTWRQGKREPVAASGPVSAEPLVADDDGAEDMKNDAGYTECWPKDWLPQDFPNVRVLMVGYDTYLSAWGEKCPHGTAKRSLDQRATKMLQKLKAAGVGERPIIFVTHSMGGLLVKQMLFHAMRDPNMEGLFTNTRSVVFYSTPHRGSSLASKTEQAKYLLYPSVEVKELVSDSPKLLKLHDEFINIAKIHNISVLSIGEMSKTPIGPRGAIETHIVPPTSADPGIGDFHLVTDNHLYVCKPRAPSSPAYRLLVEHLSRIVPRDLELHIAQASSEDHLFLDMFHMS
ncbi:PREDICTED: protein SERAC1-like, partial [Priapulus caudatus]|uniref:Protein SERAC1 n=1 Tax=Priapulus caudatus TaxID=37621 RepID=A0ABM1F3D0_PRICU